MNRPRLIIIGLLVVAALLTSGCAPKPKSLEPLTDEEWDRMVEIALDVPEVSEQLEKALTYKLEVKWVAISKRGGEVVDWGVLTDEEVEIGIPHGFLSSFNIYPGVLVHCLEPDEVCWVVAVDLDRGEVVHVDQISTDPMTGLAVIEEAS
jgi:hypothetical protein